MTADAHSVAAASAQAMGRTDEHLPWRLMVLALTAGLVPPEPALKGSVRVHMASKEEAA